MSILDLLKRKKGRNVSIIHGVPRLGDVRRNYSDISKAREVLGFEPKYDLEKGQKETLNYYISRERV
jgi:nucleoside-diphosphate-sugar epimerase